MSLQSKVEQYDILVKQLFELIEREEESDLGVRFNPVIITCSREQDRQALNHVLEKLKQTMEIE